MDFKLNIPFHRPLIEKDDIAAVVETLESGWMTTGPAVKALEQEFAGYVGAKHGVAVNSCTAAMHLALAGLDIGAGHEVITSPYTFVATAEAIQYTGAKPVFADIREEDFNIDPCQISEILAKDRSNVRALLPVHIAGHPCDMRSLVKIARENDLSIVEDAAHCLEGWIYSPNHENSKTSGQAKIGTIGDATCFSFYATKNMTSGEGGMVATDSDDLAEKIRTLALHGMSRDAWKRYTAEGSWNYEIVTQGYKYNMPDILAALARVQLKKVPDMYARRRKYATLLREHLDDLDALIVPQECLNSVHAWHLFIVRLCLDKLTITRNQFIERLREHGIQTSVHFIPLHLQPYYRNKFNYRRGDFPVAEKVFDSVVSLPLYPAMTEEQITYLYDVVRETIEKHTVREKCFVPEEIA
ncbi:MAG: DegT/DnrJ/EryC1/StrS family aminotransferase [bacterium]